MAAIDAQVNQEFSSYSNLLSLEEIPLKYQILLFKKASYLVKRIETTNSISPGEKKLLQEIFTKADDFDDSIDDYDFDELSEKSDAVLLLLEKKVFQLKHFGNISFITWNYQLELVDGSNSGPLYSKEQGICLGGGASYSNSYWGISTDICYAHLDATVAKDLSETNEIEYRTNTTSANAVLLKSIAYWRPKEDISIGLGPLVVYHNTNHFSYGWIMDATWTWDNYNVSLRMGDIKNYSSSVWQMGVGTIF